MAKTGSYVGALRSVPQQHTVTSAGVRPFVMVTSAVTAADVFTGKATPGTTLV